MKGTSVVMLTAVALIAASPLTAVAAERAMLAEYFSTYG